MAFKRRNMSYESKMQKTTEIEPPKLARKRISPGRASRRWGGKGDVKVALCRVQPLPASRTHNRRAPFYNEKKNQAEKVSDRGNEWCHVDGDKCSIPGGAGEVTMCGSAKGRERESLRARGRACDRDRDSGKRRKMYEEDRTKKRSTTNPHATEGTSVYIPFRFPV
ncbi:hypothetical protein AAG570_010687 [Ranatra chinensis]|uniref:Uncharacterized protein n=1 Tax=Ranatra chinensis TaxID=642074 RepID=A0ABD0YNA6_9HEMI